MSIFVRCDHLVKFLNVVKNIEGHISLEQRGSTTYDKFKSVAGFLKILNILAKQHPNFPYQGVGKPRPVETIDFAVHSFKLDEGRFIDNHLNFSMHGESTFLHAEPAYKLEVDIIGRIGVHDFFEKF